MPAIGSVPSDESWELSQGGQGPRMGVAFRRRAQCAVRDQADSGKCASTLRQGASGRGFGTGTTGAARWGACQPATVRRFVERFLQLAH